jgi:hypothetical protein
LAIAAKKDGAGTALGNAASELGAGEAEIFTQDPQQGVSLSASTAWA